MRRQLKRSLSFMLVVVMVLSLMPTSVFAEPTGINKGLGNGSHLVPSTGAWQNMGDSEAARFLRISLVEFPKGQDELEWRESNEREDYEVLGSINVYNKGFKTINTTWKLSYYNSTAVDYLLKGAKKTLEDSADYTTLTSGEPDASNWISCEQFASDLGCGISADDFNIRTDSWGAWRDFDGVGGEPPSEDFTSLFAKAKTGQIDAVNQYESNEALDKLLRKLSDGDVDSNNFNEKVNNVPGTARYRIIIEPGAGIYNPNLGYLAFTLRDIAANCFCNIPALAADSTITKITDQLAVAMYQSVDQFYEVKDKALDFNMSRRFVDASAAVGTKYTETSSNGLYHLAHELFGSEQEIIDRGDSTPFAPGEFAGLGLGVITPYNFSNLVVPDPSSDELSGETTFATSKVVEGEGGEGAYPFFSIIDATEFAEKMHQEIEKAKEKYSGVTDAKLTLSYSDNTANFKGFSYDGGAPDADGNETKRYLNFALSNGQKMEAKISWNVDITFDSAADETTKTSVTDSLKQAITDNVSLIEYLSSEADAYQTRDGDFPANLTDIGSSIAASHHGIDVASTDRDARVAALAGKENIFYNKDSSFKALIEPWSSSASAPNRLTRHRL